MLWFLAIAGYFIVGMVLIPAWDAIDDRIVGRYADERDDSIIWHVVAWPVTMILTGIWTVVGLAIMGVIVLVEHCTKQASDAQRTEEG